MIHLFREMRDYLKMRQDIDSKILLKEADFSQNYAKRVVLLQHRQEKARAHEGKQQSQAAAGPSQQARTEADERALESILKDGGQLNFRTAGSGSGIVCVPEGEEGGAEGNVEGAAIGPAVNCYDSDLALARAMQQEENRRAGLHSGRWGLSEDGSYEDDDPEDYSDDSEDNFGEVAAGGWRVRANQQAEDVANDEDVSCLEVKKFAAGDEGGHCPVCQETWAIGDEQRVLPCGHGFHPVW